MKEKLKNSVSLQPRFSQAQKELLILSLLRRLKKQEESLASQPHPQ